MQHARCAAFLAAGLVLAGCARTPTPAPSSRLTTSPPGARAPAPTASSGRYEPLRVSWTPSATPPPAAGALSLVARIEYAEDFEVPLGVELRQPSGLEVLQGEAAALPPSVAGTVRELRFTVRYAALPSEDLVLVLDAQGQSHGVHAEVPYRFGRPEPVGPAPSADGPPLVVNGVDFGRSVEMSPR